MHFFILPLYKTFALILPSSALKRGHVWLSGQRHSGVFPGPCATAHPFHQFQQIQMSPFLLDETKAEVKISGRQRDMWTQSGGTETSHHSVTNQSEPPQVTISDPNQSRVKTILNISFQHENPPNSLQDLTMFLCSSSAKKPLVYV